MFDTGRSSMIMAITSVMMVDLPEPAPQFRHKLWFVLRMWSTTASCSSVVLGRGRGAATGGL